MTVRAPLQIREHRRKTRGTTTNTQKKTRLLHAAVQCTCTMYTAFLVESIEQMCDHAHAVGLVLFGVFVVYEMTFVYGIVVLFHSNLHCVDIMRFFLLPRTAQTHIYRANAMCDSSITLLYARRDPHTQPNTYATLFR